MSEQPGKYAQFEFERRFVVERLPEGIAEDRGWRITDHYIENTRLRLRRMEPIHGGQAVLKLGQKQAPTPPDFTRMAITNIYLSPSEYDVLAQLPALELHKRRHPFEAHGLTFGVDVFEGHLSGLMLAEVGFETTDEMARSFSLPTWVRREVSDDVRFTGGALAGLTADQAADLVRGVTRPEQ